MPRDSAIHQLHKPIAATPPDDRFDGRQLIVVSNREPCVHEFGANGDIVARPSVGGAASALDPVMRAMGDTWIAHGRATRIATAVVPHCGASG